MRIFLLLIWLIVVNVFVIQGQVRCEAYMPAFSIDVDANAGLINEHAKLVPISMNYPNTVNSNFGNVKVNTATSTSLDMRFCYSSDPERKFGIAIGFVYNKQVSNLNLDSFHVEFSSTDFKGNIFRQLITAVNPISETINMYSIKIPLLLSYRKDFSVQNMYDPTKLYLFLTVDAGVVYNLQLQNTWRTNANFNYEAIYDFTGSGNNSGSVYDNNPIPNGNDLIITQNQFIKNNPTGNVNTYFSTKNAAGLSVGLNEKVKNNTGNFMLANGTLGYTVDAAMNFKISKKIFFKLGAYYLAETFSNTAQNNTTPLTTKIIRNASGQDVGVDYNSLMNSVNAIKSNNYGITFGLKFFISSHSLLDFQ